MTVGLHGPDLVQRLVDVGGNVGDAILAGAGELAYPSSEQKNRRHGQRYAEDHEQGQFRAGNGQHNQPTDQQQQVAQGDGGAGADDDLDQRRVVGQPRNHLTGPRHFKEAGREFQQVAEYRTANVGGDPLADPGNQIEAAIGRQGEYRDHAEQGEKRLIEQRGIGIGKAPVDHLAQALADGQHRARGEHQGDARQCNSRPVRFEKLENRPEGRDIFLGRTVGYLFLVSAGQSGLSFCSTAKCRINFHCAVGRGVL